MCPNASNISRDHKMDFMSLNVITFTYELIGVIALGWGIATPSNADLKAQAGTYYDANPHFFKALLIQRMDARFGVVVLVLGLFLQLLSVLNPNSCLSSKVASSLWLFLVALLLLFFLRRFLLSKRDALEILNEFFGKVDA